MKNQKKQKYLRKAREKGITLIALVITVIVLLILAGVSIGMITRDNGIVGQANQAKEDTIVADEKESLNMAIVSCMGKNKLGESIGDRQLEDELEKNQKEATVTVAGNDLEVTFDDTQHKYMVYQDGTIEQIIEGLGNYLVGDKYYDTFQEAFEAAESGSVIKVIYNTTEDSQIVIDKDITINTNRRTISLTNNARITINEKINVDINGNGVLTSENGLGIILNRGNLTTSNITMESPSGGSLQSTIVLIASGNFTSDNCNIDSITNEGETATINGGKYETLSGYPSGNPGTYIINDAEIASIELTKGGTTIINSGKIGNIFLSNDRADIYLTIGNINETVNNNNPEIQKIEYPNWDMGGINTIINFYNGIIKECFFDLEYSGGIGRGVEYNIRPGYKAQTTSNGTILVNE